MTSTARRLSIAAIATVSAGCVAGILATPAQAATSGPPCSAAARACVDLSTQQGWLMTNGKVDYGPVSVRTGRSGAPTDPGTFHVTYKDRDHISSVYHVAMPYAVFFNGGDAFHEGSLAESSHGCVHLSASSARMFYNSLAPGDEVQVER
ncbi:MAG TPA: L,D-transpeptidase [Pseudonocardiaceae bacterium]|jgi:lipoprotein-anchoring transpeptidase ErfK/SrfK|nr:L,D-transpeptidase [Pseudonocardiaceae bacterium]